MQKIDSNSDNLYSIYCGNVSNIREVAEITIPTKYFSLLGCADFQEFSTEDISYTAEILLEKGNLYFCAWGTGCERAHDIYDEVITVNRTDDEDLVMTTWHNDEPLDDALWFVLYLGSLYEKNDSDCSTIVIVINNDGWEKEILMNLSGIEAFNERMVDE